MVSSSQTNKWKGWIVGLQLANNTHLQPITLFLLFWQKITENSNSSAASLCSPISASLPLVMERFFQQADKHYGTSGTLNHWWFTKHIEINMDQLLWPSDDLSVKCLLTQAPFDCPEIAPYALHWKPTLAHFPAVISTESTAKSQDRAHTRRIWRSQPYRDTRHGWVF